MTFKCSVCGSNNYHMERVSEVFQVDGRFILVEDIPATVCSLCGEETFSREATEAVRQMLYSDTAPEKTVSMTVFAFQPKAS
jgi:HTH-type transcriptional regulator/antitoxin MqsA